MDSVLSSQFSFGYMFIGLLFGGVIFIVVWGICNTQLFLEGKQLYAVCGIAVAVAIALGILVGYLGRTELISSDDFANKDCEMMMCNNPAKLKLTYNFSTEYYCEEEMDYCLRLTGDIPTTKAGEDSFGHSDSDAWTAAQDIVSSKLKSPSTAEFCKKSSATITKSGDTWTIKGYVDAQNSFGATLRNNFTVKITFTSVTKYTIDVCEIN